MNFKMRLKIFLEVITQEKKDRMRLYVWKILSRKNYLVFQ